jgi:hypothetical protein
MRSTCRTMLAAVVAVLALSAVAASAASAHEFIVAGSPVIEGAEAKGTGGTVKMAYPFGGGEVQIECKSSTVTNALEYGGKSSDEYTFAGCKIPTAPNCSVPSITYKPFGSLAGTKGALTDKIASGQESGFLFNLEIKNTGEKSCTFKGTFPVDGGYTCTLPGIETEATEHEFACEGTLKINGGPFTLCTPTS